MLIFCCITWVTVTMAILYILVLKTIFSRHRQVEPSNSTMMVPGETSAQVRGCCLLQLEVEFLG